MICRGSNGPRVRDLQRALNLTTGSDLKIDGVFGSLTESALKDLQLRCKIHADGKFGKQSARALLAMSLMLARQNRLGRSY